MSVSIVTVSYNSSHILPQFIQQLGLEDKDGFELIIVDSGSDDAGATYAIGQGAGATVILSRENVGYGIGSNMGAAKAKGEWLVFVNPDVTVSREQLDMLVSIARKSDVHCIGPKVASSTGELTRSWGRTIRPPWRRRDSGFTEKGSLIFAETISGCCMAISAEEFGRLGGFDSRFFMFCEEMDLHRRLGDADGRIAVACDIVVQTPGGASSLGVTDRWRAVERMVGHTRYVYKHFSRFEGCIAVVYNIGRILFLPCYRSRLTSLLQYAKGIRRRIANT